MCTCGCCCTVAKCCFIFLLAYSWDMRDIRGTHEHWMSIQKRSWVKLKMKGFLTHAKSILSKFVVCTQKHVYQHVSFDHNDDYHWWCEREGGTVELIQVSYVNWNGSIGFTSFHFFTQCSTWAGYRIGENGRKFTFWRPHKFLKWTCPFHLAKKIGQTLSKRKNKQQIFLMHLVFFVCAFSSKSRGTNFATKCWHQRRWKPLYCWMCVCLLHTIGSGIKWSTSSGSFQKAEMARKES